MCKNEDCYPIYYSTVDPELTDSYYVWVYEFHCLLYFSSVLRSSNRPKAVLGPELPFPVKSAARNEKLDIMMMISFCTSSVERKSEDCYTIYYSTVDPRINAPVLCLREWILLAAVFQFRFTIVEPTQRCFGPEIAFPGEERST